MRGPFYGLGLAVIARKPGSRSVTSTDNSTTLAALSRKVDLGVLCGCGNSLTEYALVALVNLTTCFKVPLYFLSIFWLSFTCSLLARFP